MKIAQLVSGMYIASAGPTYSIARLSDELIHLGEDVSILTSGRKPGSWPYLTPIHERTGWMDNRLSVSPGLAREIRALACRSDILHGHSMWRFANNIFPLVLDRSSHAKIVCSPRGSMSVWSMRYKGMLKQPFWRLIQKPALERCHCFHATSEIEYKDIRRVGLSAPVAIIPNGIDIPQLNSAMDRKRQMVFLGRINPVKGIDILIRAWAEIGAHYPAWELLIVGPLDSAYAHEMRQLANTLCGAGTVRFAGELLGPEKEEVLAGAALFVLPSHSENFGMVVAEALVHELPVITTTGTPWADLEARGCGWWVEPELGAFAGAMQDAMCRPIEELRSMGRKGRDWMEREYSWSHIAGKMLETYQWLQGEASRPGWVVIE